MHAPITLLCMIFFLSTDANKFFMNYCIFLGALSAQQRSRTSKAFLARVGGGGERFGRSHLRSGGGKELNWIERLPLLGARLSLRRGRDRMVEETLVRLEENRHLKIHP